MPSNKVSLEKGGQDIWAPTGYQAPSPAPGAPDVPPGWNTAPHEEDPTILQSPDTVAVREERAAQGKDEIVISEYEIDKIIQEAIAKELPKELVNLDRGVARFAGHTLNLTTQTLVTIKQLLAKEAAGKLKSEQERILASVRDERVQGRSGHRKNVPTMQGPEKPVGKGSKKRPAKVRRVRKPATAPKPANVPVVPSSEGGTASAESNS